MKNITRPLAAAAVAVVVLAGSAGVANAAEATVAPASSVRGPLRPAPTDVVSKSLCVKVPVKGMNGTAWAKVCTSVVTGPGAKRLATDVTLTNPTRSQLRGAFTASVTATVQGHPVTRTKSLPVVLDRGTSQSYSVALNAVSPTGTVRGGLALTLGGTKITIAAPPIALG